VPVVSQVTEVLASLRDALPATGQAAFLSSLSDLLGARADLYGNLQDQIQNVIDQFDRFDEVPSISMLKVDAQDLGNEGFIREYFNALNPPSVADNAENIGIVLYGGTGLLSTLGKIFPI
jgi:hypothetical protein